MLFRTDLEKWGERDEARVCLNGHCPLHLKPVGKDVSGAVCIAVSNVCKLVYGKVPMEFARKSDLNKVRSKSSRVVVEVCSLTGAIL